jgi:O-antigen/teichoic acid export membrane protein
MRVAGQHEATEGSRADRRPLRRTSETVTLLASAGLATLLGFTYNVWCGRRLGVQQYADLAAALAIAGVLAYALNPLGLVTSQLASRLFGIGDLAAIRRLYVAMQNRTLRGIAIASILVLAVTLIGTPLLQFQSRWIPFLTYLVVSVLLLLGLARGTLRALHRFGTYVRGLVAEAVLRLGVGIPLVWLSPGAPQALIGYVASAAAVLAFHERAVRRLPQEGADGDRGAADTGRLVGAAWALLLGYALGQNLDLLVVKSVASRSDAGSYAAAWTLARGLMVLTMPLDALLLPRLGTARRPGDALARMGLLFGLLWVVPVAVIAAAPGRIIIALFGGSYAEAAPLLPWLATATMLLSLTYLTGQALLFLQSRQFLVTLFAGMIIEFALIAWADGDLPATVRAVVLAQAFIIAANFLWLMRALSGDRVTE